MLPSQYLPTLMIVIDFGAAFVYGFDGNWRMFAYWSAAAVLTAAVTF